MRIAFLLPNYSGHWTGSNLVYYRFAEGLAREGHVVDVWHPARNEGSLPVVSRLHALSWSLAKSVHPRPIPWHRFANANVRPRFRPQLGGLRLHHDLVVAFSWRGLEALDAMKGSGRRAGYVVEYETWKEASGDLRGRMRNAYLKDMPILASSRAVADMLEEIGASDVRLSVHGIDREVYRVMAPTTGRSPMRIGCPIRMESVKSPEILLAVLRGLRETHGKALSIWGFGGRGAPSSMLELFDEVHPQPSSEELAGLLNGSGLFLLPSRLEGFGMPAAEAMSCGVATLVADNGGIRTFGVHGENCWIVPPDDADAMLEAARMLLSRNDLREQLAGGGASSLDDLAWPRAVERFRDALGIA